MDQTEKIVPLVALACNCSATSTKIIFFNLISQVELSVGTAY